MKPAGPSETATVDPVLRYAFAPVHKRALGIAVGVTTGALVALATLAEMVVTAPGEGPLVLLSQFFYGYEVSLRGALIGFFWGGVAGFVGGWFLGFLKNLFTAIWIFGVRVKSAMTQPFLDHI